MVFRKKSSCAGPLLAFSFLPRLSWTCWRKMSPRGKSTMRWTPTFQRTWRCSATPQQSVSLLLVEKILPWDPPRCLCGKDPSPLSVSLSLWFFFPPIDSPGPEDGTNSPRTVQKSDVEIAAWLRRERNLCAGKAGRTRVIYRRLNPFVCLSYLIYPSIQPSLCSPIHLSVCPSIHPLIHLSIHPTTHPSIYSSIHPIYLAISHLAIMSIYHLSTSYYVYLLSSVI